MTIQLINLGGYANDGTGDDLRTAFTKVNNNFSSLESSDVTDGENLGTGAEIFAQKGNMLLQFKTLTSTDGSVTFTSTANTVNLQANLVDNNIEATVYGIDVRILSSLLSLIMQSNQTVVDLGNILNPNEIDLEMGNIEGEHYIGNELNFGTF